MASGYVGRIANSGAQVVKAPNQKTVGKQATVKGGNGKDLRANASGSMGKK